MIRPIQVFLLSMAACLCFAAKAADVEVAATQAARNALTALASQFEKQTGHRVVLRFSTTNGIRDELLAGRQFDVVVLTTRAIDELAEKNLIAPSSKIAMFRSGVGISAPLDSTFSIRTSDELRAALMASNQIALSMNGASGPIMNSVFERLGIADVVKAKLAPLSGLTSTEAVAAGKAQLGFTQVSEILEVPKARLVGPLPPDLQVYSYYSAAIAANAANSPATKAFVTLLESAEGKSKFQAMGLEPL